MKKILFLAIVTTVILSACRTSKPVHNRFYLLEFSEEALESLPKGTSPMTGKCEILPVKVAPVYASHQIALREESHSIRYFTFNEWAQRPESRLTEMLMSYFETNRVFEKTGFGRLDIPADHIFETRIHRLLVDYQQEIFIAELDVEFVLSDAASGKRLFHRHTSRIHELPDKNLNDFAAAISEMFAEELQTFTFLVLGLE